MEPKIDHCRCQPFRSPCDVSLRYEAKSPKRTTIKNLLSKEHLVPTVPRHAAIPDRLVRAAPEFQGQAKRTRQDPKIFQLPMLAVRNDCRTGVLSYRRQKLGDQRASAPHRREEAPRNPPHASRNGRSIPHDQTKWVQRVEPASFAGAAALLAYPVSACTATGIQGRNVPRLAVIPSASHRKPSDIQAAPCTRPTREARLSYAQRSTSTKPRHIRKLSSFRPRSLIDPMLQLNVELTRDGLAEW